LKSIVDPIAPQSREWPWVLPQPSEDQPEPSGPTISIITPSYNQGDFIEETIRSVIGQDYPHVEFIVIDGGSDDQTVSILEHYDEYISYWESEPDEGQTHAINKGIRQATGDWIAYLNSDDIYYPGALKAVAEASQKTSLKWIAGHTQVFGAEEQYELKKATNENIEHPDQWVTYQIHVPLHSSFVHASVFKEQGLFKEQYQYAFDMEFYMRIAQQGYRVEVIDQVLAGFRIHDQSKTRTSRIPFLNEQIEMLYEYQDSLDPERFKKAKRILFNLLSDHLIYDVAEQAREMPYRKAMDELTRALSLQPKNVYSRHFWGAVKRVLF
jgi:glycosyltransferase involved in cell wall biosynthesis